ncbi:GNAT family N-acetyltransferase [Methanosarcina sp. KYL-1]|nr:GNAT family N-acetyltransferase [Methanosarcina sp. KYL-1]
MTETLIRKAEKKDLLTIQKLLSTYFLDMEELEAEDFILAEKDGKVIGCAALIKRRGNETDFQEIHSIAVHPNFRGKGIGRELVEHLIKNDPEPALELYVRTTAPGFFEKLGFEKLPDPEKLRLWEDCKKCEHFGKCAQQALKFSCRCKGEVKQP